VNHDIDRALDRDTQRGTTPGRGSMTYAKDLSCPKPTVFGTRCGAPVDNEGKCWARSQHAD
jgi:hypothetical protein